MGAIKARVNMPVEGLRPSTVVTFDRGAPLWRDANHSERVGQIVGIAEIRNDLLVVDVEIDEAHKELLERPLTYCGWSM